MTKTAHKPITVAVAGNPNSGKTTIFNNLTGSRQRVGNYPGVTVEWKQGHLKRGDVDLELVDLPGTYSLTAFSEEELVARDYLLEHEPDVVVDVVDAANLERNLFLTTELLEIGRPLILVLNMTDVAHDRGLVIDAPGLAEKLGVPVVLAVGNRGIGMQDLIESIIQVATQSAELPLTANVCLPTQMPQPSVAGLPKLPQRAQVTYGEDGEAALTRIEQLLPDTEYRRWQAVKLMAGDEKVLDAVVSPDVRQAVAVIADRFAQSGCEDPDTRLARLRYAFIDEICAAVCRAPEEPRATMSDRIDRLTMHPIWGVPVFLVLMYVVFTLTFSLGNPLMNLIDGAFTSLAVTITGYWPAGADSPLQSLLVDGIIGGVGGVIVFVPNIVLLFLAIAILEGTGYMARAAFVMDRFMSKVGLHGKSFIPLLIGFGCTVPAIMATRTLETRRDRLITMLVLPLMSCGARLPIYTLLIPAFFAPRWQGPVLWVLYVTGILLALLAARLLRATVFRGETTPFLMELPPYRVPTAQSLVLQMWTRAWLYVKKAGTVILGASVILWVLTFYPKPDSDYLPPSGFDQAGATTEQAERLPYAQITDPDQKRAAELSYAVAGRVGRLLEPILKPLGMDWRIGTALVGAIAAKEVFVAQMGIVFAVGEADETNEDLRTRLQERYSPLVGLCIMLFALISTPCVATFAVTRQESGSVRWAFAQAWGLTMLAWLVTFLVYRGGLLLGLGTVIGGTVT